MTTEDFPSFRWWTTTQLTNTSNFPLVAADQFQPATTVLEGIDLVDDSLAVNNQARVWIGASAAGGGHVTVFQAFTYATSQGSFSWRGSIPINPLSSIGVDALVGTWSVQVWGTIIPSFRLNP